MSSRQTSFVLTSSESKRLIAKGVAGCKQIKKALENGIVAVAKGTTNAYVAEELSGEPIDKTLYCTGTTTPARKRSEVTTSNTLPDLVYRAGQRWDGCSATDATGEMKHGDVFVKGANALNYERNQAAVLIGHPTGGTVGAALGKLVARRATLLIPVGLEKNIPGDLNETARMLETPDAGQGPSLWSVNGMIFTELEALQTLCGVEARAIGSGGILGGEGAVWLSVWGEDEQVENASALIAEVQGEPPFGEEQ